MIMWLINIFLKWLILQFDQLSSINVCNSAVNSVVISETCSRAWLNIFLSLYFQIKNLFSQLLKDMMAHQSASQHLESSPSVLLNYFSNSFPLTSNLIFTSTLSPPPLLNSVPLPFPSISLAADNNRTARRLCSHVYNLIQGYFDLEEEKGRGKVDALFEMIPFEDKNDTDRVVVKNVRWVGKNSIWNDYVKYLNVH